MKAVGLSRDRGVWLLAAGDVVALVLWVVAGLGAHQMNTNWLPNVIRVSSPFVLGWFAVAPFTGAYRLPERGERGSFMLRSAATWLLGTGAGLALRATAFRSGFVLTFALVTLAVTGILVLGWRAIYAWLLKR